MRICSNSEMRNLDLLAQERFGIEQLVLMENAGQAATQIITEHFPNAGIENEILVFAGKGNNAGDAFVVARHLLAIDRQVRVFHLSKEYQGAAKKNFDILLALGARPVHLENMAEIDNFLNTAKGPFTIVDGLLGTGLRGTLDGLYYDLVELINRSNSQVISLDIPSGVNGDTGAVHGSSIVADLTISFGFPKLGHLLPPGAARRGKLINVDISLPPQFKKEGDKFLLRKDPLSQLLKERDRYGHKNSFGHTLLIGGSPGRLGAIAMSASAAHKMGTGLVTVATWSDSFEPLLIKLANETMAVRINASAESYETYKDQMHGFSSMVIGPGLGLRKEAKDLVENAINSFAGPIVFDADALNLISDFSMHGIIAKRRSPTVLTPHPGEMARLLKKSKQEILADPIAAVREAVNATNAIVVLKGAATIIGSSEEKVYFNHYPNDGMATAGSGDVLAGMIGGLLGQSMEPFAATRLGVYLHSLAGDFAARNYGHRSMTAPDIIENICNAFKEIKTEEQATCNLANRTELL